MLSSDSSGGSAATGRGVTPSRFRPQAVQDEGQVPAPDLRAGLPGELCGVGQQEDEKRDVGRLEVGSELPGRAQLGSHTTYLGGVLGPLILTGAGLGMVIAPSINTGTFGVAPQDAGVASATVTVGQQLGASIGTSLLNTIFASAVASYIAANAASARVIGVPALTRLALLHGYDRGFAWTAGILAAGSIVAALVFRRGPLVSQARPATQPAGARQSELGAGPSVPA
jgi:hypothetical protein